MTAAWAPTADIGEAAYVVLNCQEVNSYLNHNDYDYSGMEGVDGIEDAYNVRHFFFTVQKVVDGAWSYDTANNHIVIVKYLFGYDDVPSVVEVLDEDLWYADYAYAGYANPMYKFMNAVSGWGARCSTSSACTTS
jgi:hypothetical protein